jgi:hypothetical protein
MDFFRPIGSEKKNAAIDPIKQPRSYNPVIRPWVRAYLNGQFTYAPQPVNLTEFV